MTMYKRILLVSAVLISPVVHAEAIHKTIVKKIDLTHDGIEETVSLEYSGKSITEPFIWKLKVAQGDTVIYENSRDDSGIEMLFTTDKSATACTGTYEECKIDWYDKGFMESLLVKVTYNLYKDKLIDMKSVLQGLSELKKQAVSEYMAKLMNEQCNPHCNAIDLVPSPASSVSVQSSHVEHRFEFA